MATNFVDDTPKGKPRVSLLGIILKPLNSEYGKVAPGWVYSELIEIPMTRGLEILDVVLVPVGVLMLLVYQAQLAYRIRYHPSTTVLGINHINRRVWVRTMMQDGLKNGILSVQTLRNEIMASALLATAAITLCAIIGALISTLSSDSFEVTSLLLGDKRKGTTSIKFLCVLICFLVAFMCNIQSVRYYCHVSFLISIPLGPNAPGLQLQYVNDAMSMGAHFWSLGLRAFYFSFPMFLWLFGPIPMFLCSLILTIWLHFLDTTKDFKTNLGLQGPRDNELLAINNSS